MQELAGGPEESRMTRWEREVVDAEPERQERGER